MPTLLFLVAWSGTGMLAQWLYDRAYPAPSDWQQSDVAEGLSLLFAIAFGPLIVLFMILAGAIFHMRR